MSPPSSVAVLGGGGHAKVIVAALQAAGQTSIEVFDDDPALWGLSLLGAPIQGPIEKVCRSGAARAVAAIGDNRIRQRLDREVEIDWITVVHPRAHIDPTVRLGPGAVVMAGVTIQPDTVVGRHAIVNTAATIDHDSVIGDFAHIAPGARLGGSVQVGEGAFLGIGTTLLPGTSVGAWALVGAGGVVLDQVAPGAKVMGVPARAANGESR